MGGKKVVPIWLLCRCAAIFSFGGFERKDYVEQLSQQAHLSLPFLICIIIFYEPLSCLLHVATNPSRQQHVAIDITNSAG